MATQEDLDEESENDEETNLSLMETSSRPDSHFDSDIDDEVSFKLTRDELVSTVKDLLKNVQGKTK